MKHTAPGPLTDRGSASAYLVLMTAAVLALAGLVLDGGTALATRGHAQTVAQQAARAGADALSVASLHSGTPTTLRLDPAAARLAARRVLDAAGMDGTVTVSPTVVTVTAHATGRTALLTLIGINQLSATGTATASPIAGLAQGG
jgi:hypothetical protein